MACFHSHLGENNMSGACSLLGYPHNIFQEAGELPSGLLLGAVCKNPETIDSP